jgi:demethylmenaquinone methyltransferase/2-methoxy-6-polyprenyl-1,4-benzoquinol methylase
MSRADLSKQPEEVAAMFDDVAKGYDRTNNLLSGGNAPLWRIQLVRAVNPQSGEKILDLAAGTGTSSVALAASGASVVAGDFSEGMLDVGRAKHGKNPQITFVHADAMKLPFKKNEFDAVTMSFGLRNVLDAKAALKELFRVTKPGGRIVICEFSTPTNGFTKAFYKTYLTKVMPAFAKLSSTNSDAYTYLAESIEAWPSQPELAQWMLAAGFEHVAYRNLTGGIVAMHRGIKPLKPSE